MKNKPVLVSEAEIANRRRINAETLASFALSDLPPANPETQHIFDDWVEGRIATNEEVVQLLHEHYSTVVKNEK
ncbi:antitoxin VbhA family protein [Psychrobacter alimentarius]|uniref:antitoxin VbhA family protein n=1 Tax=Psychrobacter alimentarius TaxID=261164 RepID=UPI00191ADDF0|nr:antitoxin VbhA family protein [Psychrobacter alimentarius]